MFHADKAMAWDFVRYADRFAVEPLVDALYRLLLATRERPPSAEVLRTLSNADETAFRKAMVVLTPHKVFPLLRHQLTVFALRDELPAEVSHHLDEVHRQVRALNMLHLLSAATALKATTARNEPVLLLKGLLFADSYYPDFNTRPMGDIDLVSRPGRASVLFEILERAGFRRDEQAMYQEDAVLYVSPQGVTCDAHSVLRMFAHESFEAITRPVELKFVRGVSALELEPNAMLAHLVVHFAGHYDEIGPVLLWLIDCAFVLRRAGNDVDPDRVRAILRSDHLYGVFLRILGLLLASGEPLPAPLRERAASVPPFTLGEVLRQRRITPWGLPFPKGWARLVAHKLSLHRAQRRPEVEPLDLVLWPVDALTARVTPYLAR